MPDYKVIVWIFLILATVSFIIGILDFVNHKRMESQRTGILLPYLRFSEICLLFVIAVSLFKLVTKTKE